MQSLVRLVYQVASDVCISTERERERDTVSLLIPCLFLSCFSAVLHYIISFINAIIMLQSQASVRAWQGVKEKESAAE